MKKAGACPDDVLAVVDDEEDLSRCEKPAEQLVDRAGHWPQEEQPEIVSRQLISFMKST
jgi:pimeloyl-ACP methyl ester carboxylesterase